MWVQRPGRPGERRAGQLRDSSHHLISPRPRPRHRHWGRGKHRGASRGRCGRAAPESSGKKARGFKRVQDVADIERVKLQAYKPGVFSSQDNHRASAQHYDHQLQQSSSSFPDRNEDTFAEPAPGLPHHYSIIWLAVSCCCQFTVRRFSVELRPPTLRLLWLTGKPCISLPTFPSPTNLVSPP